MIVTVRCLKLEGWKTFTRHVLNGRMFPPFCLEKHKLVPENEETSPEVPIVIMSF